MNCRGGSAYYNEIDRNAAAWLRELIAEGLIAPGDVDERSIVDVKPDDLKGYCQTHWFAGVGGWSLALRLAGVPDGFPVWTGSCPCQPFSSAGKRQGAADTRHLWPEFRRLIRECRPERIFGEQVASAEVVGTQLEAAFVIAVQAGDFARANKLAKRLVRNPSFHYWRRWLDGISADLAEDGYALWPEVCGAHSLGAPHIRQRLFWYARQISTHGRVGDSANQSPCAVEEIYTQKGAKSFGMPCGLADAAGVRRNGLPTITGSDEKSAGGPRDSGTQWRTAGESQGNGATGGLADAADANGGHGERGEEAGTGTDGKRRRGFAGGGATGPWADYTIIPCRDGKARRVGTGIPVLVDGIPYSLGGRRNARAALLKGFGNAILPPLAAEFIRAALRKK